MLQGCILSINIDKNLETQFVNLGFIVNIEKHWNRQGLEPMVTLHHFVHPLWFEDLGAFEDAANIGHFVDYAVACIKRAPHLLVLSLYLP